MDFLTFRKWTGGSIYFNYMANRTILLDKGGKHIEIDGIFSDTFGKYLAIYDTEGKSKLYDKDGNVVLGEVLDTDVKNQYELYPNKYAGKLSERVGAFCSILNVHFDLILEVELQPEQYLIPQKYYYVIPDNADNNFIETYYDYNGNILMDGNGNPYRLSNEDYLFSIYEGHIDILDTRSMERIHIAGNFTQENTGISKMNDQLIGVTDYTNLNQMKIYDREGNFLLEIEADYYFLIYDYIVLSYSSTHEGIMSGSATILDQNGKILYQADKDEQILGIYKEYVFTKKGDTTGLVNFEGEWLWVASN